MKAEESFILHPSSFIPHPCDPSPQSLAPARITPSAGPWRFVAVRGKGDYGRSN
jgi:hypothetical protein